MVVGLPVLRIAPPRANWGYRPSGLGGSRQSTLRAPAAALFERLTSRPLLALAPFGLVFAAVPVLAPYNDNLYDDEASYIGLSRLLAHGHFLTGRDNLVTGPNIAPNLWFGPGMPLVLTPFAALHAPLLADRLLGSLFLFAAVLVFYALLRLVVAPPAALVGAAALAVYFPLYTVIAFVHSEPLALLLVVTGSYAGARYLREGRLRWLAAAGLSFCWLAITRVEYGWVLTVLLVAALVWWALTRRPAARRAAAPLAVALVLCTPWLAYSYSVTGDVFQWGTSGPLSLYWMTSPYSADRGDWHGADSVFSDPRLAPHRPFFRSIARLDLSGQNARLESQARKNVTRKPLKFAENIADNVSRMLFNVPYSFKPVKRTGLVYSVPAALLLAALAAAWVRARRRRRRLPLEVRAIAAFGLATLALHAFVAGYPRLLFPIVPIAIMLVVVWWERADA